MLMDVPPPGHHLGQHLLHPRVNLAVETGGCVLLGHEADRRRREADQCDTQSGYLLHGCLRGRPLAMADRRVLVLGVGVLNVRDLVEPSTPAHSTTMAYNLCPMTCDQWPMAYTL